MVAVIAHHEKAPFRNRDLRHFAVLYIAVPVGALVQFFAVEVYGPVGYAYPVPRHGYNALHALFRVVGVAADYYIVALRRGNGICELFREHPLPAHERGVHGYAYALHRLEYEGA